VKLANLPPIAARSPGSNSKPGFLSTLLRLLRSPRRAHSGLTLDEHYRQTSDGVSSPEQSSRRTYWILSRSLYRVKTIALSNVAANRRAAAIQLELTAWTPFRQTAHYVIPQGAGGTHALLMAWDKDAVEGAQVEAGVAEQGLPVIPEDAFKSFAAMSSDGDGISVHSCLDGVEAIVMHHGVVAASQWWHAPPNQIVWTNFRRIQSAAATAPEAASRDEMFPSPLAARWLARPAGYARGQSYAPDAQRETWIVAAAALLLVIPSVWFANDFRRHAQALTTAEKRLASTEQELDGLLGARGNAVGSLARAARFDVAFNQIDALSVFAEVSRTLGAISKPGALVLTEWDWRPDGSDLRSKRLKMIFTTTGSAPAATALVKAFEANPAFRDVQVNGEGSRLSVELRVEQLRTDATQDRVKVIAPATTPTPPLTMVPGARSAMPAADKR